LRKYKVRKYSLLLSLFLIASIEILSPPSTFGAELPILITGKVQDKVTLEPIDGALITCGGASAISIGGKYDLYTIPGTWTLEASADGYEPYSKEIIVGGGDEIIDYNIEMVPISTITTTTAPCFPCPLEVIYGVDSEETETLRHFRDNILAQTPEGQELIRLYYQWSPAIVKAMEDDEEFREEVSEMIDGVLSMIRGVE
jgi:hypothetical protein